MLERSKQANVGHIGSALSIADIVAVLYGDIIRARGPADPERDRFILSKGHAVLAVYAALHLRGWLSEEVLETFCGDGTAVAGHPIHTLPGIDFSTGSLGMGLGIGVGAAVAGRMQGSARRVFVLVSDAECNEGSLWESVMFAAHARLGALVAIVDFDRQQAMGPTAGIIELDDMAGRWRAFGWDVHEVDGHDAGALISTIGALDVTPTGRPHVLIANTVFGRGVSYMERQVKWHYWPMSDDDYTRAMADIASVPCATHSSER